MNTVNVRIPTKDDYKSGLITSVGFHIAIVLIFTLKFFRFTLKNTEIQENRIYSKKLKFVSFIYILVSFTTHKKHSEHKNAKKGKNRKIEFYFRTDIDIVRAISILRFSIFS